LDLICADIVVGLSVEIPGLSSDLRAALAGQLEDPENQTIIGDTKFARYTDTFGANRWVIVATRTQSDE
jgi:hypothetical protein